MIDDVLGVGLFPYMDGCVDVFQIFLDELVLGMRFLVCVGPLIYRIASLSRDLLESLMSSHVSAQRSS